MARLTHPSKPSARHITLSATVAAAIAIALYVWLVALPASELEAQSNSAPTITAHSPSNSATVSLTTGETERFSATASDPDSNIVKWGWYVDNALQREYTFLPGSPRTRLFDYSPSTAGNYTLKSTFTDEDGESASVSWSVEVTDQANRAPTVSIVSPSSPVSLTPGSSQTFSVNATDPDDNISEWEWFLDDVSQGGGSLALTGDITRTFSHTFSTVGVYVVEARFTDEEGESGSVSWTVTVPLTMQLGAASYTVDEDDGEVDITVTLSASPPEYISARLSASDGTAEAVSDYGYLLESVSFSSGTTTLTQTFPVTIVDDSSVEPTESFTVKLEPGILGLPSYVSLTRSEATVTIHDDDEATVGFERNRLSVSEANESIRGRG